MANVHSVDHIAARIINTVGAIALIALIVLAFV